MVTFVTPEEIKSEGFKLVRNALANDNDLDLGDNIRLIELNGSADNVATKLNVKFGQMVVFSNGDVYYKFDNTDPDYLRLAQGQTETESFPYKIADDSGATATSVISVTVAGKNDAPTARDDAAVTQEDIPVKIDVLANDSDVDRDNLRVVESSLPAKTANGGSVTLNADGTVTYTPGENFNGRDTFTYSVTDGKGQTAKANVTVDVTGRNDAPDAVNDAFKVTQNNTASNAVGNVLNNDSDPDGDKLVVSQVNGSSANVGQLVKLAGGGSVKVSEGGSLVFVAGNDFKGLKAGETAKTSFTYQASDGKGGVDTATVTFTVDGKNDAPDAVDDRFTARSDATSTDDIRYNVLTNDSDPDGDKVFVSKVNGSDAALGQWIDLAEGGRVKVGVNGSVQFDSDGDFSSLQTGQSAQTTFKYTISDGNGATDTATAIIRIEGQNDAPVANDDATETNEDTPVKINVIGNDRDPDGDPLKVDSIFTQPRNGEVKINADGTITYTPKLNFNGTDTFVYRATDGNGGFDNATVSVVVKPINDAPKAGDDSAKLNEDSSINIDVLRNDTDVDGDKLSVSAIVSGPANGKATINADGTVNYAPDKDFSGSDSFVYRVSDGNGGFDTATVKLTVVGFNDNPDAQDDTATLREDTSVTVEVLANDREPDGDPITLDGITSGPKNGTATVNADGTITYRPNADFNGTDKLTYAVSDGKGGTDTATVTFNVTGQNDAPDANNDSATLKEDSAVNVNVLANDTDSDGDKLILDEIVTGPKNGVAKINADGTINYKPNADFNGTDSLVYRVTDGKGGFDTATVTFRVTSENDAPDAVNDRAAVLEDSVVKINVLRNDTDRDGDKLTVDSIVTGPANGTVRINADGSVNYRPNADFTGTDRFTYKVSDGNGGTDTARVLVTVKGVNDAPEANDDAVTLKEDSSVTVNVLKNDTDRDGDKLSLDSIVTGPKNGTATVNADGTITYKADADFVGTDTLVYRAADGKGGFDNATVTFRVTGEDDAPRAQNDKAVTNEDTSVKIDVLANDVNVDAGDSFTVDSIVTRPANGTVKINADGTVTYTPNSNFNGNDSFVYKVVDKAGNSDVARVDVTVNPVNDNPDAVDDKAIVREDSNIRINVLANDKDVDGDKLKVDSVVTGPEHGTLKLNTDGTFSYKPDADYNGSDSFTYRVSDGNGGFDTAKVTIRVVPVNDAPEGNDDRITIGEDTPVTVDVVRNDRDKDGDPVKLDSIVEGPKNGKATITPEGKITYVPNKDFNGTDTLIYKATDGKGGETTAKVTFTVTPVNDAPVAVDDKLQTNEDQTKTFDILKNDFDVDGDPIRVTKLIGAPAHGTVTLNNDGTITYNPDANFNGLDSFRYQITDGNGEFSEAKIDIQVGPVNDGPNANDDDILIGGDDNGVNSADDDVVVDDGDNGVGSQDDNVDVVDDGSGDVVVDDGSSDVVVDDGSSDVVVDDGSSDVVVDDGSDVVVDDGSDVVVDDGSDVVVDAGSDIAAMSKEISALVKSAGTTPETAASLKAKGFTLMRNILDNDTDLDGDQIRVIQLDGKAANVGVILSVKFGNMAVLKTGELFYKVDKTLPDYVALAKGQKSSEGFTYKITDETGATAQSKISVTVQGRNDGPDARDDSASYNANETGGVKDALNLLSNDTDPDKLDKLTVKQINGVEANVGQWVKLAQGGSVLVGADGSVDFRADGDFTTLGVGESANTSFSYQVSDGQGGVDTANVTFTVNGANDAPDARDDAANVTSLEGVGGVAVNLIANDLDPDNNQLTVSQVNGSAANVGQWVQLAGKGWALVNVDGSVDFDARGEFSNLQTGQTAQTSLTYQVTDGKGGFDTATAVFTVNGVNTAPDAKDDFASVVSQVTRTVTAVQILKDGSFEGANVAACTWKYFPEVGAWKTDSTIEIWGDKFLGLKATDGTKVLELDADRKVDNVYQNVQTELGVEYDFKFDYAKRPDSGAGTDTINVYWNGNLVGSVDPTAQGWSTASFKVVGTGGMDRLEFRESAGQNNYLGGVIDNVSLTKYVTEVSPGSTTVSLNVLNNDVDADNDSLTVVDVNGDAAKVGQWFQLAGKGWAKVDANGAVEFDARDDFNYLKQGETVQTTFTYKVTDGKGGFDTATGVINVVGANGAPDAVNDIRTYAANEPGGAWESYNLLSNDTDPNGDKLTITRVNGDAANVEKWVHLQNGGSVYIGKDGGLDFAAGDDFKYLKQGETAQTTMTYEVSDGNGGFDTATVTFNVQGVNHDPKAVDDFICASDDSCWKLWCFNKNDYKTYKGNVLKNDSDSDGDKLKVTQVNYNGQTYDLNDGKVTIVVQAAKDSLFWWCKTPEGKVTVNADGSVVGENLKVGSHVNMTYKVDDGHGGTAQANFTVASPIAFDLNHNGKIDVTGQTGSFDKTGVTEVGKLVSFDLNADGVKEQIEWLKGTGDAFLVDNRDGQASHDMDGSRLFGDDNGKFDHGYEKLAQLDSDNDGLLTGSELNGLSMWVDNGDAQVQDGELVTLAQYGISQISVDAVTGRDEQGRELIQGEAVTTSGETILTEDVWFLKQEEQQKHVQDAHDLHVDPLHHDVL